MSDDLQSENLADYLSKISSGDPAPSSTLALPSGADTISEAQEPLTFYDLTNRCISFQQLPPLPGRRRIVQEPFTPDLSSPSFRLQRPGSKSGDPRTDFRHVWSFAKCPSGGSIPSDINHSRLTLVAELLSEPPSKGEDRTPDVSSDTLSKTDKDPRPTLTDSVLSASEQAIRYDWGNLDTSKLDCTLDSTVRDLLDKEEFFRSYLATPLPTTSVDPKKQPMQELSRRKLWNVPATITGTGLDEKGETGMLRITAIQSYPGGGAA